MDLEKLVSPNFDKIGLALSGGGVRALAFHLGVLKYLAEHNLWSQINTISTVSGGSLAIALIISASPNKWPTSKEYIDIVDSKARHILTTVDIQREYLKRMLIQPWTLFLPKANLLADVLCKHWKLTATLQDLPDTPVFRFNCTTFETGKNWRFSKEKMGDYLTGYTKQPNFPVAVAVAASAAFPGLIGPLRLIIPGDEKSNSEFGNVNHKSKLKNRKRFWLWDGGVYENLALESLYKNRNLQKGLSFLLVSDASGQLGLQFKRWSISPPFYTPPARLLDIATDQTRSLRARDLVAFLAENPQKGRYLYIANSVPEIFRRARKSVTKHAYTHQTDTEVEKCSQFPTCLRALSDENYDMLVNRGYEVTSATFDAYH